MEAVKIFNVTLPYTLYERLNTFCRLEGFRKAHIVRTAIERELNRRERKAQRLGLVRLGDVIPEVMADLKARCERRRGRNEDSI